MDPVVGRLADDPQARICARAVGIDPDDPGLTVDRRGNRNLVLVHRDRGLVWRFPMYEEDLPGLPLVVGRHRAAHDLGLGAPRVLGGHTDGSVATAHLVLSYLPGLAMDDPRVAALPERLLVRLGRDIGRLLLRLRALPRDAWPVPAPGWNELWAGMALRARDRVLPRLPRPAAAHADRVLTAAVRTAAGSRTGLVHGDLGGVNVRVDPRSGRMTGVLDWDGAHPGDGAVDVAALAAGAPAVVVQAALDVDPVLREDLVRHDTYLATWAVQEALWGIEHGDEALVRDGLSRCLAATG